MKKVELLSPAGDIKSFKAAIANGCDAIYISGKDYGARKFAENFSLEEIKEATKYAHLYDKKVYITVNTLIYEEEISSLLQYLKNLQEIEVDAIIVQDFGMIDLIHRTFPNLEIHVSTQGHNHNEEGIKLLKSLGATRVVLARELSIDQIKDINVNIEKEVFIHGALCISYSGQCLASSLLLNRSGNRGLCAGICRLPYELLKEEEPIKTDGKYLISPKEFSSIDNLKELLDLNVDSLKIEGRMKSPAYVGLVTKIYRTLIDKYYNKEEMTITKKDLKDLKTLYNREFTKGFLYNEENKNLINAKAPNHQGIKIGEVIDINKKIKIKLSEDLNQLDGIRLPNNKGMIVNFLYNKQNLLINSAKKGDIILIDNKVNLKEKGPVLKTTDYKLTKTLENIKEPKIKINFTVEAYPLKPLTITISDNKNTITKKGPLVENSINNPTTKDTIIEKLSKLGNTPFEINNIIIKSDPNIFIPIKNLNEIRRELTLELINKRSNKNTKKLINKDLPKNKPKVYKTNEISFLVRNEEQLKYLLNYDVKIYTEDYILYKKYKNEKVFYRTPRVMHNFPKLENENLLISELGALNKYSKTNNTYSDIYINVVNSYTVELLSNQNIKKIGLSVELNNNQIEEMLKSFKKRNQFIPNIEILVYGKIELMLMKYCPLNKFVNKEKNCSICKDKSRYYLKDRNNQKYELNNKNCITRVMHYKNINKLDSIDYYKKLGITNFRIDLLDENENEIKKILKTLKIGV